MIELLTDLLVVVGIGLLLNLVIDLFMNLITWFSRVHDVSVPFEAGSLGGGSPPSMKQGVGGGRGGRTPREEQTQTQPYNVRLYMGS